LTYDHAPDVPEEKRRIYTKGGEIRKWTDGYERVFVKGRVFPCLSTTRSLGDEVGALVGISSEPEVTEYTLSEVVDKFILIGSAPVFTYLDDNEILNVLNYATPEKIRETGDILMKKAKNGWEQAENTYDDMTLICAYFMWKDHHIKQAK
jgi:Serine/threonine protein phosphatase